jgi:hypothetical protein
MRPSAEVRVLAGDAGVELLPAQKLAMPPIQPLPDQRSLFRSGPRFDFLCILQQLLPCIGGASCRGGSFCLRGSVKIRRIDTMELP